MTNDCKICGISFKPTKGKKNIYCSISCYRVAQRRGDYIGKRLTDKIPISNCSNCGKEIRKKFSECRSGEKSKNVFCDRSCYDKYRIKLRESKAKKCKFCGKLFTKYGMNDSKVYCSMECRNSDIKPSLPFCKHCGQMFIPWAERKLNNSWILKGNIKMCSHKCLIDYYKHNEERKEKISLAFSGENHPNWQGGRIGNRGENWGRQRRKTIQRDKNCQICGMTMGTSKKKWNSDLEVHHIIPFRNFDNYKEANNEKNLILLCKSCHKHCEYAGVPKEVILKCLNKLQ